MTPEASEWIVPLLFAIALMLAMIAGFVISIYLFGVGQWDKR